MNISKSTRYALYAAAEMARAGDAPTTVAAVAERYRIPEGALAKVFQQLVRAGLATGTRGIRVEHLLTACVEEFKENEDLPNTTNPDDWAKISGKKGERIVFIRTLVSEGRNDGPMGGRSIERVQTGQYL